MALYKYHNKKGDFYGVRFRVVEHGKEVHKNLRGFKTQKEAKKAQFDYEEKAKLLLPIDENKADTITVGQLFPRFVEASKGRLSPASLYDYKNIYDKYISNLFADTPIEKLTRRALSDWQDGLPSFSASYLSKIRTVFSNFVSYAVEKDLLPSNPFVNIRGVATPNAVVKHDFWTLDEFRQFDAVVDNPLWSAFFMFLYVSGCRKGEAFALTWADIDLDSQMVKIEKSHSKRQHHASVVLGVEQKIGTKNKKSASIYLPAEVCRRIAKIRPKNALKTDFVFTYTNNQPLAENTVRRALDGYTDKAGVKRIRVHDFRHSCASLIISQTDSELTALYSIAERLRDKPEQILKTYGHLFPSQSKSVNEKLDTLF